MGIRDKDLLERIFNKLYDNSFYGSDTKWDYVPYEFEVDGEIQELHSELWDLKQKIAADFTGDKECDSDDYPKLHQLELLYDKLWKILCYKFFVYGVLLNLHATEDSKELFVNKDSESIARKMKLISEYVDRETELTIKADISKAILLNMYKKEWLKIESRKKQKEEMEKRNDKHDQSFLSKLILQIKNLFN